MNKPIVNSVSKWPLIAFFTFILGITSVFAYQKYQILRTTVLPSPSAVPTLGRTNYQDALCNIDFSLPAENPDADNRSWQVETHTPYSFLGFFQGKAVAVIHRNSQEASGYIFGIVIVACGQTSDSLAKLNADLHAHLTLQTPQNTPAEALIELTANNDVMMWGMPAKEMTFVGGMFNPQQKYYLLINVDKWYLITKKSDSLNPEINQQTDQIFDLLKFTN